MFKKKSQILHIPLQNHGINVIVYGWIIVKISVDFYKTSQKQPITPKIHLGRWVVKYSFELSSMYWIEPPESPRLLSWT